VARPGYFFAFRGNFSLERLAASLNYVYIFTTSRRKNIMAAIAGFTANRSHLPTAGLWLTF
jgi:hypothetical protein